ncbi:MAG: 30S ribosome-binding factor RbfA [Clostridia bacterium]|nr:30S ribosome-binding factor RbfA [Clostridia bacterium]
MDRIDRISEEIKKELSGLIRNEIKDPRLPEFVSITAVRVTKDLRFAKIYVSVLGDEAKKKDAIAALVHAAGFIRHEIGHRINLRYTPEFHFELDNSIEQGMHISRLIDQTLAKGQESKPQNEQED